MNAINLVIAPNNVRWLCSNKHFNKDLLKNNLFMGGCLVNFTLFTDLEYFTNLTMSHLTLLVKESVKRDEEVGFSQNMKVPCTTKKLNKRTI